MNLESPKITVNKSSKELFDYLSKVENFESIMPDNTDKFEAREDSFVFALKGMPEIKLRMLEGEEPKKVVLGYGRHPGARSRQMRGTAIVFRRIQSHGGHDGQKPLAALY